MLICTMYVLHETLVQCSLVRSSNMYILMIYWNCECGVVDLLR